MAEEIKSAKELGLSYNRNYGRISGVILALSNLLVFLVVYYFLRKDNLSTDIFFSLTDLKGETQKIALDWYFLVIITCLVFFRISGLYTQRRIFWDDTRAFIQVLIWAATIDMAIISSSHPKVSLLYSSINWIFVIVVLPIVHYVTKRLLIWLNIWQKPTIIVGIGENARQTCLAMRREKLLGFDIKLFVNIFPNEERDESKRDPLGDIDLPVINITGDPYQFFQDIYAPHTMVALEQKQLRNAAHIVDFLTMMPNSMDIVPSLRGLPLYGLETNHLFGRELIMLRVRNNLTKPVSRVVKRIFDIVVSLLLLALLTPAFLYIVARIRSEDKGNPFFSQERVGFRHGRFNCFKFRSMLSNAEEILMKWKEEDTTEWKEYVKSNFKLVNDPRVTKIGKFLRSSSMDELPQLWNVLIGDMSLVGPRPLLEREIPDYGRYIRNYTRVRPGITGLWQISGRSNTTFSDRAYYDDWYIKNWSIWYDIVILFKTVPVVFGNKGAY